MRCPYCKAGRIRSSANPYCPECGSSLWEMLGEWPNRTTPEEENHDRDQAERQDGARSKSR